MVEMCRFQSASQFSGAIERELEGVNCNNIGQNFALYKRRRKRRRRWSSEKKEEQTEMKDQNDGAQTKRLKDWPTSCYDFEAQKSDNVCNCSNCRCSCCCCLSPSRRRQRPKAKASIKQQQYNFKSPSAGFILLNVLILLFPIIFLLDRNSCDSGKLTKLASFVVQSQEIHMPPRAPTKTSGGGTVQRGARANRGSTTIITTTTTTITNLKPIPKQRFRQTPPKNVSLTEGESVLLRCEVTDQVGDAQWLHEGVYIFHQNGKRWKGIKDDDHFTIVGNSSASVGEHNLEIHNVQARDAGWYECQINPDVDGGYQPQLQARTVVTVHPRPQIIIQPSISTSGSSSSNSNTRSISSASSSGVDNNPFSATADLAAPIIKGSQLQTRDIPGLIMLPSGHGGGPSSSAFITPHASTAHPTASVGIQSLSMSLMLSWPYMLLIIAALLMLANIYVIYSLVKRHTNNICRPRSHLSHCSDHLANP